MRLDAIVEVTGGKFQGDPWLLFVLGIRPKTAGPTHCRHRTSPGSTPSQNKLPCPPSVPRVRRARGLDGGRPLLREPCLCWMALASSWASRVRRRL